MKYVAVRILEQYDNIKEYFLKFLPKEKSFKYHIKPAEQYKRSENASKDHPTEGYKAFCAFYAGDVESFLLPFQSDEPKIHLLYPVKLLSRLMNTFICKRFLSATDPDNVSIDVLKKENWKPVKVIDIRTRAKVLFGDPDLMTDEKQQTFRSDCLKFDVTSTKYILDHLPLHVSVIKHSQYLHPEKINDPGATSNIQSCTCQINWSWKVVKPERACYKGGSVIW